MAIGDIIALRREYRDWKARKRSGPEAQIAHRTAIKAEIESNLRWPERDASPEIIVRDLARMDQYPETDDSLRGISPWFKVEALGLYHRGFDVALALREIVVVRNKAHDATPDEREQARTLLVAGRIPFDAIVAIDWSGDEYYPQPHFYCWFDQSEGPYESVELREKTSGGTWRRLEGIRYKPGGPSRLEAWRARRELREAQREFERQLDWM
jgi:hypothetical protein